MDRKPKPKLSLVLLEAPKFVSRYATAGVALAGAVGLFALGIHLRRAWNDEMKQTEHQLRAATSAAAKAVPTAASGAVAETTSSTKAWKQT